MSWKTAGKLLSGPPLASGSGSNGVEKRLRPNSSGLNAYQREQEFASHYSSRKGKEPEGLTGRTDWDVLKENHRFIRDDEEPSDVSWEERLARAYESKLFKEFALIDLKHYKSRRLALRWRTAEEVVEGIGEDTCGSLRCKYHPSPTSDPQVEFRDGPRRRGSKRIPALRAFELPFVYQEGGERKEALVKVRLCRRCEAKLVWKPDQERSRGGHESEGSDEEREEVDREERLTSRRRAEDGDHSARRRDRDSERSERDYHRQKSTRDDEHRERDRERGHAHQRSGSSPRQSIHPRRSRSPTKHGERRLV